MLGFLPLVAAKEHRCLKEKKVQRRNLLMLKAQPSAEHLQTVRLPTFPSVAR